VLTVRTDKGDYVLDNLTDKVKIWDATGYRFLKRQAIDNTGAGSRSAVASRFWSRGSVGSGARSSRYPALKQLVRFSCLPIIGQRRPSLPCRHFSPYSDGRKSAVTYDFVNPT